MKKLILAGVLAAVVLMLAACGSGNNTPAAATNSGNSGVENTETAAATEEVVITATNWQFDKPEYTIKKGVPTKITLKTDGIHEVDIPDLNVKDLKKGKSQTITVNDAGEYELHCSVPCGTGHAKMTAKIIVE